jgi:uncharacterized protein YodC (DUF2158 family)
MIFKPGDVVQLNSGGPLMTVSIVSGQVITCEWFDDKQQVLVRGFGAVSLKTANNLPVVNQKADSPALREKKVLGAPPPRPAAGSAAARSPAVAAGAERTLPVAAPAQRPAKPKGEAASAVPNGGAPAL